MPWTVYLALKQLFPSGRRWGSIFFHVSVLGVALGVMVLIVVQSVMGGFGQIHRARMVEVAGHITVSAGGQPFVFSKELEASLRQTERVRAMGPHATGIVLAELVDGNVPQAPEVIGVDPLRPEAYGLSQMIVAGTIDDLGEDTVILSSQLARTLGAQIGDELEVLTPAVVEALQSDEVLLPQYFEVVGFYSLEWDQEFAPGMIVTLEAMQEMYRLGDRVHGVMVRLEEGVDEFAVAERWNNELPFRLYAQTWKERFASFLWVLDLEKTMLLFITLFIVAVASFAIAIAQLLNVLRKTREIGVLGALGGLPRDFWVVYCMQGALIGALGTVVGIVLAVSILSVRDPIIEAIATLTGSKDTLVQFYYFSYLPVDYALRDFVVVAVAATGLSTLAGLVPAWRAARLRPAKAIRADMIS